MAENATFITSGSRRFSPRVLVSILLLAGLPAGLIGYKAHGGLKRINELRATGSLQIPTDSLHRPAGSEFIASGAQTLAYLNIVWPALVFGALISPAVHATVSPRHLATLFGQGLVKPQLAAAAAGAPLMLCSCCVAPMFPAVYRRSRRLGPSVAFTLAAPALNPAALTFSFLIFPLAMAGTRLAMALVLVVLASALVARIAGPVQVRTPAVEDFAETGGGVSDFIQAYFRSLWYIT